MEFPMFTVLYSMSKDIDDNEMKEWQVIGSRLETSADKRNTNLILCSYPISIFVPQNKYTSLHAISNTFLSTDINEVLVAKKTLVTEHFQKVISKLKQ